MTLMVRPIGPDMKAVCDSGPKAVWQPSDQAKAVWQSSDHTKQIQAIPLSVV